MEEEDNTIVKWAQEDVETSYNLLNIYIYIYIYVCMYVCSREIHSIYFHCSTRKLNKDNSTELNSCIAYSTKATYDVRGRVK